MYNNGWDTHASRKASEMTKTDGLHNYGISHTKLDENLWFQLFWIVSIFVYPAMEYEV
jgi:hypothetical protein